MTRRSDTSLGALLLVTRLIKSSAPPLNATEYWSLLERVPDPSTLLGHSATDIDKQLGDTTLDATRVVELLDRAPAVAFELERIEALGIQVVTSFDDAYPSPLATRLGSKAPPLLHAVGPVELLCRQNLGIVGSRDVDEAGAEVARGAAIAAVERGWGVVSGGARGVDRLAMNAAVNATGTAVGILADSLVKTTREPELRRLVSDGQVCLATPFAPTMGFTPANAMARNKIIYALAERTFVVASDHERGGTWSGAKEALSPKHGLAVDVWVGPGEGPGNRPLLARGARAIADLEQIWSDPTSSASPPAPAEQLHLHV